MKEQIALVLCFPDKIRKKAGDLGLVGRRYLKTRTFSLTRNIEMFGFDYAFSPDDCGFERSVTAASLPMIASFTYW